MHLRIIGELKAVRKLVQWFQRQDWAPEPGEWLNCGGGTGV